MLKATIDYTAFEKRGRFEDSGENYHYFNVGVLNWQKTHFLIEIDSACAYNHARTFCLAKLYKTKNAEITILGYSALPNEILRAICDKATSLYV